MAGNQCAAAEAVKPSLDYENDRQYVYFHSGSEATYRKISSTPTSFTSIPTIDIADIDDPARKHAIAREIYDACHTCGFFYAKNHGLSEELLKETFDILHRFFALDNETKISAHNQLNPAIRGYEPMFETKLDPRTKGDLKEAFSMGDCVLEQEQDYMGKVGSPPPSHITKSQNIWPKNNEWFRAGLYKYYNEVLALAMKLVQIFTLAFGLEEDAFDQYFKFPIAGLRPLHYPPTPLDSDDLQVGLGAHADFSWFTLVLQDDIPALEVLNMDGQWVSAEPKPNTLVCNVGQYLEKQSNGVFPATVHRVRNKTGERRYSLPFFLSPDPDAVLKVLSCCIKEGEAPKYEPTNVGQLYIERILPARQKHPTSIKYKDVPKEQWKYEMLLS